MALVNRIARLFKADLHAVLDQIEEPEQLLKQAIREMEEELTDAERRIALLAHGQAALSARTSELQTAIGDFDQQLDLCFASGKDDLARSLIRKRLEAERLVKCIQARHAANEQQLCQQRSKLTENSATLDRLRQKAEIFAHRSPARAHASTEPDDVAWVAKEMTVDDDEVEIAYLREKSARSES